MAIYSEFSHKKMVIFHSYVKLPEGKMCFSISAFLVAQWVLEPRQAPGKTDFLAEIRHMRCLVENIYIYIYIFVWYMHS